MRRLLPLLALAILMPATAWADSGPGLADMMATAIAYLRAALLVAGIVSVFQIARAATSGQKVGRWIGVAVASLVAWPLTSVFLSHLGVHLSSASAVLSSGRSANEYLDEQTGLLQAGKLSSSWLYQFFVVIVFFSTLAFSIIKHSAAEAAQEKDKGAGLFYFKVGSLLVVAAALNPTWTYQSTNDAQAAVKDILAHQAAARRAAGNSVTMPGPLPAQYDLTKSAALSRVNANGGMLVTGSNGTEPFPIVWINRVMDQFVAWVVSEVSDSAFQAYGMAQLDSMKQGLATKVPGWMDNSLKQRLRIFIDQCTIPEIQSRLNGYPGSDSGLNADPQSIAQTLDPLSSASLSWFAKNHRTFCSQMVNGGYKIGAVTYPYGLQDELLASMAVNDPRMRADFPAIQAVSDALQNLPSIKGRYTDWKSNVESIFLNAASDYRSESLSLSGSLANAWQNVNGVGSATGSVLSGIGAGAAMVFGAAKGSFSASQVTVAMPQKMSEACHFFLIIYPFVYLGALALGLRVVAGYVGLLLSTKAYVIPWAMVANHVAHRAAFELHQSAAAQISFIQVQQEFLEWSPWLVVIAIWAATGVAMHQMRGGI